ncbi:MAG TPA: hypothetical protein VGI32_17060 [Steroidobacteraceae bacterium]
MNQIYEAAAGGHLDQAQQMITQVLADHPNSAKAHFVQAELYAKEGKNVPARAELGTAERLNPGLTEFKPRSVQELKSELGLGPRSTGSPIVSIPGRSAPHFPWGGILIGLIVVGLLMMLFRRRTPYNQYPVAGGPGVGGPAGYGPGGAPGYGPAPMGGGMGSGIAGGLASGLAVGAGVVAGEELAHHFLDGGHREGGVIPSADAAEPGYSNSDMGGNDFGANDPGSWDDGGGGLGGGGGDDWS